MGQFPTKELPLRAVKMERIGKDVIILSLQLPANKSRQYCDCAGQYIKFLPKNDKCAAARA